MRIGFEECDTGTHRRCCGRGQTITDPPIWGRQRSSGQHSRTQPRSRKSPVWMPSFAIWGITTGRSARAAGFSTSKSLEDFSFDHQPWLKRETIAHLATALGLRATQLGHRVLFATATGWVTRLQGAHQTGRLSSELIRLRRYGLIMFDEVGYFPFEQDAANLFLQLVSSRDEDASMILTSNLSFARWGDVLGDQVGRSSAVVATVYGSIAGEVSLARCSMGLCQPRISRGLRLSSAATLVRCSGLWTPKSVPFGKYWRSRPLVFSFDPRCQGLAGSQKYTGISVCRVKSWWQAISVP